MKTWIVTGGVASGKSAFCKQVANLVPGAEFFNSDEAVHALMGRKEVRAAIGATFGVSVLNDDGSVSRHRLRERVFADADARRQLEALLHPLVYQELSAQRERLTHGRNCQLLVAEVPLFYESGQDFSADWVIVVATGATLQQERLTATRGLEVNTVERIRAAQWPLHRKLERADKVVWNEGSIALLRLQAEILVNQLDTP